MYIKVLEDQPWALLVVRPRWFGKSLFINMMRLYYDKLEVGNLCECSKCSHPQKSPCLDS